MAARAAERAERRRAAEPPEPDMPTGHEGHHNHVRGNGIDCSCGEVGGCFSFAPDPRYWSDDPAEVAAVRREEDDYAAWISCRICGERGVVAEEDWGTWPPRTLEEHPANS
jgi:hypothetical protein